MIAAIRSVLCIAVLYSFASLSAVAAWADGPTHVFKITSATTTNRADCGPGGCSVACMAQATLRNLGVSRSPRMTIIFHYKHPSNPDPSDPEGARFAFSFPNLEGRKKSTDRTDALGVTCAQLVTQSVRVTCTDDTGRPCSNFINVNIEASKAPRIKAQTVAATD